MHRNPDTRGRRGLLGTALALPLLLASRRSATAQSLAEIRRKGKVVIGIQGDNAPWGFVTAQGQQDGFDADVGRLFGQFVELPVEFLPLAVANRIPSLVTGRADILFATMGMYPDRARAIQFSKPYASNEVVLVAPRATRITQFSDLANMTIGVARSSAQDTAVTAAAPSSATIRRFDDDAATIQAMLSGQVQAVGANQFYPGRLNRGRPDTFEKKLSFLMQYNGAGTRLGQREWNETANSFVDRIRSNGELARLYTKWLDTTMPEFPASIEGVPFTVP